MRRSHKASKKTVRTVSILNPDAIPYSEIVELARLPDLDKVEAVLVREYSEEQIEVLEEQQEGARKQTFGTRTWDVAYRALIGKLVGLLLFLAGVFFATMYAMAAERAPQTCTATPQSELTEIQAESGHIRAAE